MTFLRRSFLLFICGIVQIFFSITVLMVVLGFISFDDQLSKLMFFPGVLIIITSAYMTLSYYFGNQENNAALYDEYFAARYYKLASVGYALNGIGLFVIFSMQDYTNWTFQFANNMIFQIAGFAWLIFGVLLVWFSIGDYQESKSG